jgi:hypothetical protein
MRTRSKYDSILVWLYAHRKEQLIPETIRSQIPYSTISTWQQMDYTSYVGHTMRNQLDESLSLAVTLEENKRLKKVITIITKTWIAIADVVMPTLTQTKKYNELLVNQVQRLATALPLKLSCKLFHISTSAFRYRLTRLLYTCSLSEYYLCMRKHPAQLAQYEVKTIKSLCSDQRFACWPLVSIYYFGLREGLLSISKSTFYKYTQLLELKRRFNKPLSKIVGIRAKTPNAYLHIDTTFVKLPSFEKVALVFVSDNFSRAVLGSSCSLYHGAQNVRTAIEQAMLTIRKCHPHHICSYLVADGGSENNNQTIDFYLDNNYPPHLTKIIAQKDIAYSNSPVEAINKIMKRYLRHYQPQNLEELKQLLPRIIDNYQNHRPHGSLKGLTPMEAYTMPTHSIDFRTQILLGKTTRVRYNQQNACKSCRK